METLSACAMCALVCICNLCMPFLSADRRLCHTAATLEGLQSYAFVKYLKHWKWLWFHTLIKFVRVFFSAASLINWLSFVCQISFTSAMLMKFWCWIRRKVSKLHLIWFFQISASSGHCVLSWEQSKPSSGHFCTVLWDIQLISGVLHAIIRARRAVYGALHAVCGGTACWLGGIPWCLRDTLCHHLDTSCCLWDTPCYHSVAACCPQGGASNLQSTVDSRLWRILKELIIFFGVLRLSLGIYIFATSQKWDTAGHQCTGWYPHGTPCILSTVPWSLVMFCYVAILHCLLDKAYRPQGILTLCVSLSLHTPGSCGNVDWSPILLGKDSINMLSSVSQMYMSLRSEALYGLSVEETMQCRSKTHIRNVAWNLGIDIFSLR